MIIICLFSVIPRHRKSIINETLKAIIAIKIIKITRKQIFPIFQHLFRHENSMKTGENDSEMEH